MIKLVLIVVVPSFFFISCSNTLTSVMPYEREYFAQEKMQFDPIPSRTEQEAHVFLIREASAGGESSFQGGCGCR
ncbi:MAG: DUF4266 domain-containing protein [Aquificae bacterium]|nr:DUF4266 domain-containing protein [Aquificota bacterium]